MRNLFWLSVFQNSVGLARLAGLALCERGEKGGGEGAWLGLAWLGLASCEGGGKGKHPPRLTLIRERGAYGIGIYNIWVYMATFVYVYVYVYMGI